MSAQPTSDPAARPVPLRPLTVRERNLALAGPIGVAVYVGTWFVLGLLRTGYSPAQDAISQLFDLSAPSGHRVALSLALVVTGVVLIPFARLLDRCLPGTGRAGPILLAYSGLATAAVILWPCTAGCPGASHSTTDLMHVLVAGSGYVGLVTSPIAVGVRLRPHWPTVATWSFVLGGIALTGFLVRNLAGVDTYGGLQQRVFNTTADVWIAMMGIVLLRRGAAQR